MSDIKTAVVGINYLREFGKWVSGLRKDAEVLGRVNEAMVKVGEVQDKLYELREENLKLLEEDRRLQARVKELEAAQALVANLSYREQVYYLKKSDGTEEGPYCQRCWDVDQRLVRVVGISATFGSPICVQCEIESARARKG